MHDLDPPMIAIDAQQRLWRGGGGQAGDEIDDLLHEQRRRWPNEFQLVSNWYAPHLERLYDDAHARVADIGQLAQIASSYHSRQRFLAELTLDPPDSTTGKIQLRKDENPLVLSTIHSAKGLEWRNVYILNVIEGCIPSLNAESDEQIEEERRLLHVAMSRAKKGLELMMPRQAYRSFGGPAVLRCMGSQIKGRGYSGNTGTTSAAALIAQRTLAAPGWVLLITR